MKHLLSFTVILFVSLSAAFIYANDFHFGRFNEEQETLYALFLGIISTATIIISMSMIYKNKNDGTR
jgi:hypothetical protein